MHLIIIGFNFVELPYDTIRPIKINLYRMYSIYIGIIFVELPYDTITVHNS